MNESEKEKYNNLTNPTLGEHYSDMLDLIQDFLVNVIRKHQLEDRTIRSDDMKIVLQMMWTKTISLIQILNGIHMKQPDNTITSFVDPTILGAMTRGIFETVGMFNNVFVQPQTDQQQGIMVVLWWIAGYNYRQKLKSENDTESDKIKADREKANIINLTKQIMESNTYLSLSGKDRGKIDSAIKNFSYNVRFVDGQVKGINGFQELANNAGIDNAELNKIYTYFSLYAHPSSVGVAIFRDIFAADGMQMIFICLSITSTAIKLLCVFIADYLKVNIKVLNTFRSSPVYFQEAVQFYNISLRNTSYQIPD